MKNVKSKKYVLLLVVVIFCAFFFLNYELLFGKCVVKSGD